MRTKKVAALEEEIEERALSICLEFKDFIDGVRYLALLHRTKDGGHNKEHRRRGGFYITHNPAEFRDAVARLLTLQVVTSKPYRLYSAVNPRKWT